MLESGLAGIVLVQVFPKQRRKRGLMVALLFLAVGLGCGGGSSTPPGGGGNGGGGGGGGGGGTTDPGTPAGNYVITLTATSGTITHTVTFNLVVQ